MRLCVSRRDALIRASEPKWARRWPALDRPALAKNLRLIPVYTTAPSAGARAARAPRGVAMAHAGPAPTQKRAPALGRGVALSGARAIRQGPRTTELPAAAGGAPRVGAPTGARTAPHDRAPRVGVGGALAFIADPGPALGAVAPGCVRAGGRAGPRRRSVARRPPKEAIRVARAGPRVAARPGARRAALSAPHGPAAVAWPAPWEVLTLETPARAGLGRGAALKPAPIAAPPRRPDLRRHHNAAARPCLGSRCRRDPTSRPARPI